MSKVSSIALIALAGIAGFGVWQSLHSPESDAGETPGVNATDLDPLPGRVDSVLPGAMLPADQGAPGSMQASLLDTTERNRQQILAMTIVGADYPCPSIRTARAVSSEGLVWRVHCGDAWVYWVEVDEFDRLSVAPAPYGDIGPAESATPVERR